MQRLSQFILRSLSDKAISTGLRQHFEEISHEAVEHQKIVEFRIEITKEELDMHPENPKRYSAFFTEKRLWFSTKVEPIENSLFDPVFYFLLTVSCNEMKCQWVVPKNNLRRHSIIINKATIKDPESTVKRLIMIAKTNKSTEEVKTIYENVPEDIPEILSIALRKFNAGEYPITVYCPIDDKNDVAIGFTA